MQHINLKIAIIGAGKLAHSLTNALVKSKYKISTVVSQNKDSALELATKNNIKNYSITLRGIPLSTNIFFLTVPDDQIHSVASQLAGLQFDFRNSIFVHFSGAQNISVLKSLEKKKANTASFHIMQTFPSRKIINMNGCFAAIETKSKSAQKFLTEIATRLKLNAINISSNNKVNYHLAGVFASNFLVSNYFSSDLLLSKIRNGKKTFEIISPIIESTLKNVKSKGIKEALSGPIKRGDLKTIEAHSALLKKIILSPKRQSYKYLYLNYLVQSLSLIEIVRSKNNKLELKQVKIENFLVRELKDIVKLL